MQEQATTAIPTGGGNESRTTARPDTRGGAKKWLFFIIRWGIAVVGIWWVVSNLSLRDHALWLNPTDERTVPRDVAVVGGMGDDATSYTVVDPTTGQERTVPRGELVNAPDRKTVTLLDGSNRKMLGMDVVGDVNRRPTVRQVLVEDPKTGRGEWVTPDRLQGFHLQVPHPRVEIGLVSMVKAADPLLLAGSLLVFPVCFLLVSVRWNRLLRALDISITLYKTFVLFMVGNFYNTFLPGSTGGDVLKMVYVARMTPHKTRAVLSVLVDRIIGLLGLVILGGVMSAYQYASWRTHAGPAAHADPVAQKCLQVAIACVAILSAALFGFYVVLHPKLVDRLRPLLAKLPARVLRRIEKQLDDALDVVAIYQKRPGLILWALALTIPVHVTVVVSAMLAGKAFGLPISTLYYFVAVPVIVLVGAIPISPQGAGVMEFFAINMLQKQGATVGHALVLTMSIRVVQILWNLVGGIWVLTGGYHAPTAAEQHELEDETGEKPLLIETPPGSAT
jgi:uncharacterized protein (TIRG00374 family)